MLIDVNPHVKITCHHSRLYIIFDQYIYHFITLSVEGVIVFIGDTLLQGNINNLLLVHHTDSLTFLATILLIHLDSLSTAVSAWTSLLRVHTWTQHNQLLDHLTSFAGSTGISILASLTLAFRATSLTSVFEVNHFPLVDILKTHLDVSQLSFHLLSTTKNNLYIFIFILYPLSLYPPYPPKPKNPPKRSSRPPPPGGPPFLTPSTPYLSQSSFFSGLLSTSYASVSFLNYIIVMISLKYLLRISSLIRVLFNSSFTKCFLNFISS